MATLLSQNDEVVALDVIKDFNEFKELSDIVLVNRMDENTKLIADKIYTRDLFTRD